jgi:uncharacterized membrane protein YccC
MTMMTFEPKGDVAEWQLIYDTIKPLQIGDVITYDELTEALGRDFRTARGPFHKANRELLTDEKRGLLNLRNVGYRVVTAEEHEGAAKAQHRFAKRRLRQSKHWLKNTDRSDLTPEVAARFDRLESTLDRQIDFTRRLDQRVARVEKALEASRSEAQDHTEEISKRLVKLTEALQRHGIPVE